MIFDISIIVIFVLAAVDTLNEISNSQVNRAQELEQELVAASTSSGVSSSSSDEQSLEQAFIKHKFQEELFNLQYNNKKNDNNTSNASNSGSPVATNKKKKSKQIKLLTKNEIDEMIRTLSTPSTEQKYYYLKKHYRLTETEPPCLVKLDEPGKYLVQRLVIAAEDMFDICMKIHKNVGYQGRQGMEKEAKKFYYNVSRPIIELFLQYSAEYQTKRKKTVNHGLVVKPIISDHFNSRGQVDLVDMHSLPDGEYHYILNYQDHLTKFCHLRPLKGKDAAGVARELYQIFASFGAPLILQSDNGLEFRNQIVASLKTLWPGIEIIHGRSRKPSTQGSVERSNGDFQNILGSWMRTNKTANWAIGLPYVQYIKNRKFNKGIGMSSYQAVFGKEAYNGLELINLPDSHKEKIKSLKDLYANISV